jgi:hypothetical protein
MCICSLCQKIIFLSIKKFKQKISHVHLHNSYAFVKVLQKNNIAHGRCKKDKTCMIQCLLFSIKICLFYVGQMTSRFFIKRLCAHTTCEDVRVNFCLNFFNISNCVKYYIQIMGAYVHGSQNSPPLEKTPGISTN